MRPEDYLQQPRPGGDPPADRRGGFRRAEGARHLPARRGALSRRGPHGRIHRRCRNRWSSRSRSRPTPCCQTWFEENKADLRRARIPQDRLCQARAGRHRRRSARSPTSRSRQDYETNKARFTTPETRTIEQLVFQTPEAAQGGARFDQGRRDLRDHRRRRRARPRPTCCSAPSPRTRCRPGGRRSRVRAAGQRGQPGRRGRLRPGAGARHRRSSRKWCSSLAEVTPEIRKDLALAEANRILLDVHDSYEDSARRRRIAARSGRQAQPQGRDRRRDRPRRACGRTAPSSTTCRSRRNCSQAAFETEAGIENPADQHRQQRLRLLRGGRHHAGPRPHARRGAATRSSPTGRRPRPRSGWPPRPPSSRSG